MSILRIYGIYLFKIDKGEIMKILSVLLITITGLIFAGCGGPAYVPPRTYPLASVMKMPAIPKYEKTTSEATLRFKKEKVDINENVVQSDIIKRRSSVVINVPEGFFDKNKRSKKNSTSNERMQDLAYEKEVSNQTFKTKNFFNIAEQQIERELIKHNFKVKSRSKFEAKLRSMRDTTKISERSYYNDVLSKVDKNIRPIVENLKKRFENNELTPADYLKQLGQFQTTITKSRDEDKSDELTDISEVIIAAGSKGIKADYILQINIFETDNRNSVYADLRYSSSFRRYVRSNPDYIKSMRSKSTKARCDILAATLNAKLIHVQSGDIIWIGEHTLDELSLGSREVTYEFGSEKYVTNTAKIRAFVTAQNTWSARRYRYGRAVYPPAFKFATKAIAPKRVSGSCSSHTIPIDKIKAKLARQVAKELMRTIKVQR